MINHRLTRLAWPSWCLFLLTMVPMAASGQTNNLGFALLTGVTVMTERDAMRVDIKLSSVVKYEAVLIDEPSRLVIDFDNTSYAWRQTPLTVMTGPLKEIRGGQYRESVARLVIELTHRVEYAVRDDADGVSVIIPTASLVGTT